MTYPQYAEDLEDLGSALRAMTPTQRRSVGLVAFTARDRNQADGAEWLADFWSAIGCLALNIDDDVRAERRAAGLSSYVGGGVEGESDPTEFSVSAADAERDRHVARSAVVRARADVSELPPVEVG